MLRKVLKDYKEGFCWSRFKEAWGVAGWWMYLYLLTIFPVIMDINEKAERLVCYYAMVIPLLFGTYSLSAVPIRLPKQMFLCPLSSEERKKYVKTLFMVRLIVPVVLGIATYGAAAASGRLKAEFLCVQLFGLFSFMLFGSLTTWPGSTWERRDTSKKRLKSPKFKGLYAISGSGMISAFAFQMIVPIGWDGEEDLLFWIIMTILGMITAVCDILIVRYFKPVLDMNMDYESSYDGKVHKQRV